MAQRNEVCVIEFVRTFQGRRSRQERSSHAISRARGASRPYTTPLRIMSGSF